MAGTAERFALRGLPGDAQQRQQPREAVVDGEPRREHRQVKQTRKTSPAGQPQKHVQLSS